MTWSALARELGAGNARDEALADYVPASRALGLFPRPARMRPIGRVWRLGAYLLTPAGGLLRTGRVVRVAGAERRRSVVAESISAHHELVLAARRGGYREGETVNFDARPLDADAAHGSGAADLAAYLAERAALLIRPPDGA
ncbi:MAG: glutaminase [Microbacteriaceae bacterium]|nr:glutaminase [Microbacteriaceae bacterium]